MFSPGSTESYQLHGHQVSDTSMTVSPGAPTGLISQHVSSPFLPGYLLGDNHSQPQQHGLSSPRIWSTPSSHSPSQKPNLLNQSLHTGSGSSLTRRESTRGRAGGPPVKSLYSSPPGSDKNISQLNQSINFPLSNSRSVNFPITGSPAVGSLQTPLPAGLRNASFIGSPASTSALPTSPAQMDPFYTQGTLKSDSILDDTWVTVFGFVPGSSSFILQQFSHYGTILKHVVASECNWMHIQYQSKIQAKKALSKDGKVFAGCMKIGVTPCIEKSVMEEKENTSIRSPMVSKEFNKENALTPIRPLTAAYAASKSEFEVLQDKMTPKREHGLVSKLKEYMFGY